MKGDHVSSGPRLIAGGDAADNELGIGTQSAASAPEHEPIVEATFEPVAEPAPKIMVWDIAIRVFHWSMVAAVLTGWMTGGTGSRIHELAGFTVAALLIFRIVWGVVGTRHARFRDFVKSPSQLGAYLVDILRNRAGRHIGHNPAGGYMILAMIGCLIVIVTTGIMQLTNQFFGVPWVEAVHHWTANVVIWLVPLHVLGVIVSSWMHQENLVGAMLTGDKAAALDGERSAVRLPSEHEQMMSRLHANQGFTVLAFLLAGGLFIGWSVTSHRNETAVVEPPPSQAAAASQASLAAAIQGNAVSQMKDKQDIATGGPESVSQAWLVSSGGRLYDNWFAALGVSGPSTTHPSWPASNTSLSGDQTWRCKNCHGWDYMGRDGLSRTSAQATNIIGIQRLRGREPSTVVAILGNATHGFTDDLLPPHAKQRLALFVTRGQHTTSQYVLADGRAKGRADLGQPYFQSICASCHGFDGRTRKLGASGPNGPAGYKGPPLYVGTKATAGPAEVLHKIRNGHPGAIMVQLRSLPVEVVGHILAYAQTLPTE